MNCSLPSATRLLVAAIIFSLGCAIGARPAPAAVSATGGSGVWDVQSAESKRPGRLELGFASNYSRLALYDGLDTRLNGLQGNALAAFGLPGGFEISGSLPLYGFHTSRGDASAFDANFNTRIGDVAARLRWTGPLGMPGMRWGLEGEATLPTGDDATVTYPTRGALKPFTSGNEAYTGRAMLTFDMMRSGAGVPLRLHANAAFTQQRDESSYRSPYASLPLDLPAPIRAKDNDRLTIAAAAEFDLPRVTLFGEVLTDQFVHDRTSMRGQENRLAVTPGFNFWLPGGVALTGAYTLSLSKDDAATAFDPDRTFANHEWKVGISLGTVYRGARARAEDEAAAATVTMPAPSSDSPTATPMAPRTARLAAESASAAPTDSASKAKAAETKVILERRPIQEAPAKAVAPKPAASEAAADEPETAEATEVRSVVSAPPAAPAPAPAAMAPARPAAKAVARLIDSDGDGIPDAQDACPLMAEDWDGFQDYDGCPDLDNDQDGIPDIRDACPNDPETFNGYYDFDGCPDELPSQREARSAVAPAEGKTSEAPGRAPVAAPVAKAVSTPVAPASPKQAAPAPAAALPPVPVAMTPVTTPAPAATLPTIPAAQPTPTVARPAATVMPPAGPAPVRDAETLAMLEAERRRADQLEERLRTLELRQDQSALLAGSRPMAIAGQPGVAGPTGISPSSSELRERVTRLEAGREADLSRTPEMSVPVPASGQAAARVDTSSARLLREMRAMRASMDSLREANSRADVMAPEPEADPAVSWLEMEFPLGRARVFSDVVFESGSSRLTSSASQSLIALASALQQVPDARVRVVGHTDNVGLASANLELSKGRAQSVANAMLTLGASSDQLIVEGRGESSPIASNRTAAGREQNRRVEFVRVQ